MYSLPILAVLALTCLLGASGDVSQNLTAVWESLHDLEHRINEMEDQAHRGRDYNRRQGYGDNYGRRFGGDDHDNWRNEDHHDDWDHHELMEVAHDLHIKQVEGWHKPIYMSPVVNSSTEVKADGSSKELHAFGSRYILYMKHSFSGSKFSNYPRDLICVHNAGGSIAFHLIHPDGRHERKVLGDAHHDHHADYVVTLPGGVWESSELIDGDFAIITFIAAPSLDYSLFKHYDVQELVHEFPKYEDMIVRMDNIDSHDKPMNITQMYNSHKADEARDHHRGHHDNYRDNYRSGRRYGSFRNDRYNDNYGRGYQNHRDNYYGYGSQNHHDNYNGYGSRNHHGSQNRYNDRHGSQNHHDGGHP